MDKKSLNNHKDTKLIKTIFFDVGGVLLYDFIDDKIIDVAEKYDKDPHELLKARIKYRHLADLGRISDLDFWKRIFDKAGIIAAEEDWQLDNYMSEIEGMRDIVQHLKKMGYDIAILSNDSKEMFAKRRERFEFDQLFHDIIVSSEHGVIKPNSEIYWIAMRRMGSLPESSLFIDDRSENIKAAANIGMYTILFQDAEQLKRELSILGIRLS